MTGYLTIHANSTFWLADYSIVANLAKMKLQD